MIFKNLYIISFLISGLCAWIFMKYGKDIGVFDTPNHRSSHLEGTPKGAGLGILCALLITSLVLSIPFGFWFPALVMSLISLWGGDKHRLSPKKRLIFHFMCSLFFLFFLGITKKVGLSVVLLYFPLSIFIVGTSNFYNFMDGIDGIAGISGLVGFSLLGYYSYLLGAQELYGILCISLAFSCLGFLCFNLPKAKVFLGDVGSILLGFIFSCMIVFFSENFTDFIVMTGFLLPFYFDELFTMFIRLRNGDSLLRAHRKHIYQLLANELSISHWKISLLYGILQMMVGLTLIYYRSIGVYFLILLYIAYCSLFTLVSIKIHRKSIKIERIGTK